MCLIQGVGNLKLVEQVEQIFMSRDWVLLPDLRQIGVAQQAHSDPAVLCGEEGGHDSGDPVRIKDHEVSELRIFVEIEEAAKVVQEAGTCEGGLIVTQPTEGGQMEELGREGREGGEEEGGRRA